ncbi:MAG: hypothetical protein IIY78_03990 [Clostridia bacterium]|nr:hypothetical protein [Clostridia bacterium]
MPGKHRNPTIAFRPSRWARALIEARAKLSGLYKKDFLTRCCVYSNIVVTGTPDNIQRIVDSLQDTQATLKVMADDLRSGEFYLSKGNYDELREDLLALTVTMIDIIDGAAYLFNKSPPERNINWKLELEREDLREALKNELPPPI